MSLNEFLDGLGKIVRNSRRFDPNRPEAFLDGLRKTVQKILDGLRKTVQKILDGFAQNRLDFIFFIKKQKKNSCFDLFPFVLYINIIN
jgi:hypothetical protein